VKYIPQKTGISSVPLVLANQENRVGQWLDDGATAKHFGGF
jgi:hypothetical protein